MFWSGFTFRPSRRTQILNLSQRTLEHFDPTRGFFVDGRIYLFFKSFGGQGWLEQRSALEAPRCVPQDVTKIRKKEQSR